MRLFAVFTAVLVLAESEDDVSILFVGSRSKLSGRRIQEQRQSILNDCQQEKISCSIFDALHDFSTDSEDNLQGMWTITPAISKLPTVSEWTIIADDSSQVNIRNLKLVPKNTTFSGFGLKDRDATIIHHFGMNAPDSFQYPFLSSGFILSRGVVEKIQKMKKMESFSGFSIDATYEFSLFLHKYQNSHLEDNRNLFCCNDHQKDSCLVQCPNFNDENDPVLTDNEVYVMIKTFGGHHESRLPVVQSTWTRDLPLVDYCSDKEDTVFGTIDLGVANTDRGHCGKTWAIFRRFLEIENNAKWLLIADDDTLISWKRMKKMLEEHDHEEKIIIGERYGFGFSLDGLSGYDYPTGGSGMVFTRSAVETILETCPQCSSISEPDDMTIGMCASHAGIPIVHESRLHQARPQDYSADYLRSPISFHKFHGIDPLIIYSTYLSTEHNEQRSEL